MWGVLLFRALFGYEGHSNALKVVSTGNGGLIELTDELNSGKILYGFVSITNEKTNLIKYLLINWQVIFHFDIVNEHFDSMECTSF